MLSACAVDQRVLRKSPHATKVHVVKRGDTLSSIAKRYGVSVSALKKRNRITNTKITAGQRLYLSGIASSSASTSSRKWKKKKGKRSGKVAVSSKAPKISVKLAWPIKKPTITSNFGTRSNGKHDGLDIGAPKGTKIYAAASGEVIFSGRGPTGYGLVVIIKHTANVLTVYSHNSKNVVKKGAKVKKGGIIATVGKSGRATGYHLHFEVRVKRTAYDPRKYLPKLR